MQGSLPHKSLKTGQPSYLRSLISFPSHRCTWSSSLIILSRPSLTSRLKIANRSFCSCFMEQSPISFMLGCLSHHSFTYFKLACVWSFNLSFPKEVENPSLSFFHSLYSPRLSHDWYLQYWPSFVFSSHTHFAIIHCISFMPIFILFDYLSMNKLSMNK